MLFPRVFWRLFHLFVSFTSVGNEVILLVDLVGLPVVVTDYNILGRWEDYYAYSLIKP